MFYVKFGGRIDGPCSIEQIRNLNAAGKLGDAAEFVEAHGQSSGQLQHETKWQSVSQLLGTDLVHVAPASDGPAVGSLVSETQLTPPLTTLLRLVGTLEVVGGMVLGIQLWPGEPETGYQWRVAAYILSITWMTAGIVFGALFWAIGDGLLYLRDIRDSLRGSTALFHPRPGE